MDTAKAEVLAFTAFPRGHWAKIWSTNPLERINREIKRRARVVGIFSNSPASSASSAPCSTTSTTSGKSLTAATFPKAPWPRSTRSVILEPSPPSRLATDIEDPSKAHHSAGLNRHC
jgi:hypothetical protein